MAMRAHGSLLLLAVLVAAGSGCGQDPVPERPSYTRDIAPLMTARCIRCHGGGGAIQKDPDMPPVAIPGGTATQQPVGDFTTMVGAMSICGPFFQPFVIELGMPPPPSDRLDDWSLQLLEHWCANPLP
jgi:hypothetical protein